MHQQLHVSQSDDQELVNRYYSRSGGPGNNSNEKVIPHYPKLKPHYQIQFSVISTVNMKKKTPTRGISGE